MIILLVIIVALIVASAFLSRGSNEEIAMNDYCEAECKQNIKSKYKFCC